MTEFKGFSEAAVLYAENAALVDQMYQATLKEVNTFLDAVRDEVISLIAPRTLQEQNVQKNRYWWIGEDPDKGPEYPQFYFAKEKAEIVIPGVLEMVAIAQKSTEDQRRQLQAIAGQPEFKDICTQGKGGTWSLFTARITYSGENMVSEAAGKIAPLLIALSEAGG